MNQSADSSEPTRLTDLEESSITPPLIEAVGPDLVIPVLREELVVRKEKVPTGVVRLSKFIHESKETIHEHLVAENVEIERVPMNVIVDAPPPIRMEGDVTVISIVEEVVVTTKQLRVKEELRIGIRRTISEYQQEVNLRGEELVVEHIKTNSNVEAKKKDISR